VRTDSPLQTNVLYFTTLESWGPGYNKLWTAWEVSVSYETAATLFLRKVLDPANAAHAEILAPTDLMNGGFQVLLYSDFPFPPVPESRLAYKYSGLSVIVR
jgi:hypothetical protein